MQNNYDRKPEADLGVISMSGPTGGGRIMGPNKPENVGQQRDILWPVVFLYGVLRH